MITYSVLQRALIVAVPEASVAHWLQLMEVMLVNCHSSGWKAP